MPLVPRIFSSIENILVDIKDSDRRECPIERLFREHRILRPLQYAATLADVQNDKECERKTWEPKRKQRKENFPKVTAFLLEKLPDDVIFEVAKKLDQASRRRLMLSGPSFHRCLYGRRARGLDSRIPASIVATFFERNNWPRCWIRGQTEAGEVFDKELVKKAHDGTPTLDPDLMHTLKRLTDYFNCGEMFEFRISYCADQSSMTLAAGLLEEFTEFFPSVVIKSLIDTTVPFAHLQQLYSLLLECPQSITLRIDHFSVYNSRCFHDIIYQMFANEAIERKISVFFEDHAPAYEFRLVVNGNAKSLLICDKD